MLTTFFAIAVILLITGAWLFVDTRFGGGRNRWTRNQANLTIFHERQEDISQESVVLEEEDRENFETEAKLQLLDDVEEQQTGDRPHEDKGRWAHVVAICAILIVSITGYVILGDPLAIKLAEISGHFEEPVNSGELDGVIHLLEQRTASRPEDVASRMYLIHAYFLKQDFESVVSSHKLAESQDVTTLTSDLERVQAAFYLDRGVISDETSTVIKRILDVHPDQPVVLEMLSLVAVAEARYVDARNPLERLLRQPLQPERLEYLSGLLKLVHTNLPPEHVGIHVRVQIEPTINRNQWLTVFAESTQGAPPVAVVRRPFVNAGNYSLLLDDEVVMMPSQQLSTLDKVRVVARLSSGRDVMNATITDEVRSDWIAPAANASVELALGGIDKNESIKVTLHLSDEVPIPSDWPVFIVGRTSGSSGPPFLAKKVLVGDLPTTLTLSAADSMLRDSPFPSEGLIISARASSSGDARRSENDIESSAISARLGQSITLQLDQIVGKNNELRVEL